MNDAKILSVCSGVFRCIHLCRVVHLYLSVPAGTLEKDPAQDGVFEGRMITVLNNSGIQQVNDIILRRLLRRHTVQKGNKINSLNPETFYLFNCSYLSPKVPHKSCYLISPDL
jgi:hypothetical protein